MVKSKMSEIRVYPPSEYITKTMSQIVHTYLHNAIEVLSTEFGFDKHEAYLRLNEKLEFEHNPEHDDFSEHIITGPVYREVNTPTNDWSDIQVKICDTKCILEKYLFNCLREYNIPPPPEWREYEFIPLKLICVTPVAVSIKINKYTLKRNIKTANLPVKFNQITLEPYANTSQRFKEEEPYIVEQLLMPAKIKDDSTLEALKNLSEEMIRFQYDAAGKRYFMSKNIVYKFEITPRGVWNETICAIEHDPNADWCKYMVVKNNNVIQCLCAVDGDNYDRYELEFIIENDIVYLKADDNTVYNFKAYKIGGALPSAGYISGYDVNSIFRLRIYND
jgi:hypothetical protein